MIDPAAPQPAERTNRSGFVSSLLKLVAREDRGALAGLRRSLQDPTGMAASACPYVVPFLPKEPDRFVERIFFLVGALFALHPEHAEGVSLGHAFRQINNDTTEGRQGKDNPSTRSRFVALLDAHDDDVGEHVRHAVSLARAKSVVLDWDRLLLDLRFWRAHDRTVQARLAREFWRPSQDAPPPPSPSPPTAATASESEASR